MNIHEKVALVNRATTRDEIQEICKDFQELETNVALYWAPRVGKTKATLNMLNSGESVLIVSNTELIRDNWKKEIKESGLVLDFKSICYPSLKNQLSGIDTIVLDEADLLTENYVESIQYLGAKRFIFLTGTKTFRTIQLVNKLVKTTTFPLFQWNISFQQAIDMGILPKPSITCLGLKLRENRDQLFMFSANKAKQNVIVPFDKRFLALRDNKNKNVGVQCSEFEWLSLINEKIEYWKEINEKLRNFAKLSDQKKKGTITVEDELILERLEKEVKFIKVSPTICENQLKQLGLRRKNFLADKKNRYIQRLIKFFKVEEERVIIFANSIPQAEFISEEFVIHSGIKLKKGQKSALTKFNDGESKLLVSVGMLDRGISVYNVHTSFILQIPNSQASVMQKSSRNLLDDFPRLVLVYFRDTKDQENVQKFVSQFNPEYVDWVNVQNT